MGRIIVATGLVGWAVIVAVAWVQANARIASCTLAGITDSECAAKLSAHRDSILFGGAAVALAFILASLCVYAVIRARREQGRATSFRSANPGGRPLPRR